MKVIVIPSLSDTLQAGNITERCISVMGMMPLIPMEMYEFWFISGCNTLQLIWTWFWLIWTKLMCFWVISTENLINWDHIVPHHYLLSKGTVRVPFKFFILPLFKIWPNFSIENYIFLGVTNSGVLTNPYVVGSIITITCSVSWCW